MTIAEIKNRVEITQVAESLGIKIDPKTQRACCPFHVDKTPSLQFSQEKQIATCFSSNCNAGTMDVISLTEKKLQLTTHQAINHLKALFLMNNEELIINKSQDSKHTTPDYAKDFEQMQSSFIASSTARAYAESRNLDRSKLEIGYNAFKNSKFSYLKGCVTFGLRDENGKVVSMYGRSVRDNDKAKPALLAGRHYYTSNRLGLYPNYPSREVRHLIITESVIDAATLLSINNEELKNNNCEVLACYGTNGFTSEHSQAISQLENLKEVVIWFDGDESGREGAKKLANQLFTINSSLLITKVDTPDGEDINSLAVSHEKEVFSHLLKERNPFLFSEETAEEPEKSYSLLTTHSSLNTSNPNKLTYITEIAVYYIKGGIRKDLDSLKVTLVIENLDTKAKSRNKLDLYEDKQTEKIARESAERLNLRADLIENDLNILTDLLDEYREQMLSSEAQEQAKPVLITGAEKEQCLSLLRSENLLSKINDLIGKSGVVGEENNRLFLFGIASSYKMEDTLHALIQGSSGSGKTHLLATIMDFMPPEDTISLTRVTESSFYNYGKYELSNKLIGMEDYDGLEEKAELAFRELQSKGMISSSTSGKNEHTGEISGFIKEVYGPIASLSATTKGEIYEDNMSRCFLVAVDESHEQTLRIIKYQNNRAAGLIDKEIEKGTRAFLRNCMRLLQPYEVVNPFANKIDLPKEAHKIRRLNDLFQCYVKQVTILNQYQRNKDHQGRLITAKEDVKTAIEIMFDSIILKVDELDGSLRLFYEELKSYVNNKGRDYAFIQREIRHTLKISKTQLFRYIHQLEELEYLQKRGFGTHGAVKYKIVYWDDNQALRARIKNELNQQLDKL